MPAQFDAISPQAKEGAHSAFGILARALAKGLVEGPEAINLAPQKRQNGRLTNQRRAYAGRPSDYVREVLGATLTQQQEAVLKAIFNPAGAQRYMLQAGNNLGKTFVLACAVLYIWDVLASQPERGKKIGEQGAIIILCGPTWMQVGDTIFSQVLALKDKALERGYPMCGTWSGGVDEKGESTGIIPKAHFGSRWYLRTVTPQKIKTQKVAHGFSGRHHSNLWVFLCEAAGIDERIWVSAEAMASGHGNTIIADFNPTEPTGSAYRRAQLPTWEVLVMSALDHPNVQQRREVIEGGAISCEAVERRIHAECMCRGDYPVVSPDEDKHDFVYALPPQRLAEARPRPRTDGFQGHADYPLQVYRPHGLFIPQVLGRFPLESQTGLFDMAAWSRSIARWRENRPPDREPDRVGVDCAREGDDSTVAAPVWGRPAVDMMRSWRTAELRPAVKTEDPDNKRLEFAPAEEIARSLLSGQMTSEPPKITASEQVERTRQGMVASERVYVGRLIVGRKGDGPRTVEDLFSQFRASGFEPPLGWVIDEGGVGASVVDVVRVFRRQPTRAVAFGGSPDPAEPDEALSENIRTQMMVRLAWLVRHDLIDLPDDPALMEEARVAAIRWGERVVTEVGTREQKGRKRTRAVAMLMPREDFVSALGRSPDSLTAVALAIMPLNLTEIR